MSPVESCDNYVREMTDMAQLAGMGEDELSKALIRGLPEEMKWMVVSFNPKTIGETIERILLSEASYKQKHKQKEEVFTLEERISSIKLSDCLEKLSARLDEMERRPQWRPNTYLNNRSNTSYRGNYNQSRLQDR